MPFEYDSKSISTPIVVFVPFTPVYPPDHIKSFSPEFATVNIF